MAEFIHWSDKLAQDVIAAHPQKTEFVIASGITPSGSVHIGNFREFITTYIVGVALKRAGKKVRMIFSWDDFDRFRKVPANVSAVVSGYEKYIGTPVCDVPDPFGKSESYARHFEKEFEDALAKMGLNEIPIKYIYQHKEYRSGRYDKAIALAVEKRKEIYDIITSFKTQGAEEGERETYYPTQKFGDQLKLVWKVDWPMRWAAEGIAFEPAGADHMSHGGSHDVAKRISREIFNNEPPVAQEYGFVGIKGNAVKISSSKGNAPTPAMILNIYEPQIIRWLFEKYQPRDFFEFGFDDTIARHYAEYDKEKNTGAVSFGTLATVGPLANFDAGIVRKMLGLAKDTDLSRLEKVKYWLENFCPEKLYKLLEKPNTSFSLNDSERSLVTKLHDYLKNKTPTEKEIQEFLYSVINDPAKDKKANLEAQQRAFKIFYNLLFGRDDGPRLYLYLAVAPRADILKLLSI